MSHRPLRATLMKPFLLLTLGVFCCSTSVIWIRLSRMSPVMLTGLRCLIAAIFLTPIFIRDARRHPIPLREYLKVLLPGVILSLHFITWITGARVASVTNASLIVNMAPMFMPVVLYLVLRERVHRLELAGTLLSVAGLLVLATDDFRFERERFSGDLTCFASMLFFTLYLVLARRNRTFPSIWCYVTPLYLVSGLLSCGMALLVPTETVPLSRWEPLWILAVAVIPTVIGHSLLNLAMQQLRGQVVAVANVTQFVFAGIMAYLIFQEIPRASFAAAVVLVLAGLGVAFHAQRRVS